MINKLMRLAWAMMVLGVAVMMVVTFTVAAGLVPTFAPRAAEARK